METNGEHLKLSKARRQVGAIKGFYNHLTVYVLINLGLFAIKSNIFHYFRDIGLNDANFLDWVYWNIMITPLIWGVALFLHGLYVFKFKSVPLRELMSKSIKDWEEKQIRRFMEKDQTDSEEW